VPQGIAPSGCRASRRLAPLQPPERAGTSTSAGGEGALVHVFKQPLRLARILHALDIIRFDDAINKPGPELHALNVLIPIAVDKAEELRRAMDDMAKAKAPVRRVAYL
jgi:hypothetical protein